MLALVLVPVFHPPPCPDPDEQFVLVQRELDKSILRLRESLAFGKEVFLGMGEFWITIVGDRVGRAMRSSPPQR